MVTTTDHETVREIQRLTERLRLAEAVIAEARRAREWWWHVADPYPNLSAPWVAPLNLALREFDRNRGKP